MFVRSIVIDGESCCPECRGVIKDRLPDDLKKEQPCAVLECGNTHHRVCSCGKTWCIDFEEK